MLRFRLPFRLPTARWAQGLVAGAGAAVIMVAASSFGWTQSLERQALDGLFGARGPRFPHPKIVIVVADNETVSRTNQWPLPRRVYAQVVRELHKRGARVIAIDALFPTLSERPTEDADFVAACREAGNVVQAIVFHLAAASNSALPVNLTGEHGGFDDRFQISGRGNCLNAVWASAAMLPLRQNAKALGHVTVFPEPDGTLRRMPHLICYRDKIYPSLSLSASAAFLGLTSRDVQATDSEIIVGKNRVPLDKHGEALVNWIGGNNSFPTFSVNELLDGRVRREAIEGSLVFVGVTAAGAYEQRATPFSPNQPAVELQANAADDILSQRPLRELPAFYRWLLLFVGAVLGGLAATRLGWGSIFWFGALCFVTWAVALYALKANLWLPYATPLCAGALAWTATMVTRYRHEWEENFRADESMSALAHGGALLASGTELQQLRQVICETARVAVRAEEAHLIFDSEIQPTGAEKKPKMLVVPLPGRQNHDGHTTSPPVPGVPRGGALMARRRADDEPFISRDRALLETIAEQASMALENLEYYELLRGEIELADQNLVMTNSLLADQSAKLTAAVEGIQSGLVMTDENGTTIFCNSATSQVLRDAVPLIGSNLAHHLREYQLGELASLCDKALHNARNQPVEMIEEAENAELRCEAVREISSEVTSADEEISAARVILSSRLTPLRGADGRFLGLLLSVADITAQRELDSMKSEFVSFVAHELRSPLTSILGYSSLLQTAGDRVDKVQRDSMNDAIMRQGTRLNRLIGELLDISRIEAGKALDIRYSLFDFAALCRSAVEGQRMAVMGRSNYKIEFIGPENLMIEGDSDRLEQVLVNLLSNAVKYSPDGGEITLELKENGSEALMFVRDSGMGMSPEQIASLFQKYYRTPDARRQGIKGNGLGLYLVSQLVKAHHGIIEVESQKGHGSTFKVIVPLNRKRTIR